MGFWGSTWNPGRDGQTANLQEWRGSAGTLNVVDPTGNLGIGTSTPARSVHLLGGNACFRMDRNVNSSAFLLMRTAKGDFSTVWKTFYVGVNASDVNNSEVYNWKRSIAEPLILGSLFL